MEHANFNTCEYDYPTAESSCSDWYLYFQWFSRAEDPPTLSPNEKLEAQPVNEIAAVWLGKASYRKPRWLWCQCNVIRAPVRSTLCTYVCAYILDIFEHKSVSKTAPGTPPLNSFIKDSSCLFFFFFLCSFCFARKLFTSMRLGFNSDSRRLLCSNFSRSLVPLSRLTNWPVVQWFFIKAVLCFALWVYVSSKSNQDSFIFTKYIPSYIALIACKRRYQGTLMQSSSSYRLI